MGKKLVLGVGNLLLGDEGVGIHVIQKLQQAEILPPDVRLVDGGTGGFDLLYYLERAEKIIIVDAMRGGGQPGSVYRLTLQDLRFAQEDPVSLHQIGLREILGWLRGVKTEKAVTIIGVEPETVDYSLELSAAVRSRLPEAIRLVLEELNQGLQFAGKQAERQRKAFNKCPVTKKCDGV